MNARDWVLAREIPPVVGGASRLVGGVGTATVNVNGVRNIQKKNLTMRVTHGNRE